jgi:hypothetical protein
LREVQITGVCVNTMHRKIYVPEVDEETGEFGYYIPMNIVIYKDHLLLV